MSEEQDKKIEAEKPVIDAPLNEKADSTTIVVNAEFFYDIYKLICALDPIEVQMKITTEGLSYRAMDLSRVTMTDISVPKTLFRELKRGEFLNNIRVNRDDLEAILKGVSKGDIVKMTINNVGRLVVTIKGKRESNYIIPLFEPEEDETRVPRVTMSAKAKLNIDGILKDAKKAESLMSGGKKKKDIWSNNIGINSVGNGFIFKFSTGDGIKSADITASKGWDVIEFEGKAGEHVIFGMSYFNKILEKISAVSNVVIIEIGSDLPVHIIPQLPFKGSLSFWCAPVIENQEVT